MTTINNASRAQPSPASSPHPSAARADPQDVRAMSDAFDAAKSRLDKFAGQAGKPGGQGGQPAGQPAGQSGKKQPVSGAAQHTREPAAAPTRHEGEPTSRLKSRDEGPESLAGWAGQGAGTAGAAVAANPAAPHVDAGAFAQMLADLWTRENGRGSKEVRVRFGDRSWPATGAVLVRNAAGTLDVALQVGDGGQAYGEALPGLEEAMGQAGIALGSLTIEHDA